MRIPVSVAALVLLAAPAIAQNAGSVALDAMTTPGRHFGAGIYLTDGLSIRPSLGLGYAPDYGTTFNLGTDVRWEILTASRVSPYLTAGISYFRDPMLQPYDPAGGFPTGNTSNNTRYGGGAGVRARVKYGISLVAEARVMNSEIRSSSGYYSLQPGAHFEGAVGLSYVLP